MSVVIKYVYFGSNCGIIAIPLHMKPIETEADCDCDCDWNCACSKGFHKSWLALKKKQAKQQ